MTSKYQKLEEEYQKLLSDFNILNCKLVCKTDSLMIMSKELDQFRSERDQYKLMAEQLRERYHALKRRVEGLGPSLLGVYDVQGWKGEREQNLVQLLCELKEQNKTLQCEAEDLREKLCDSHGDVKILREEVARSRSYSLTDDTDSRLLLIKDREALVKQLEVYKNKCFHLEKDLQDILDEKEELVTARDAFRLKYERLNQQLNCLLRGDQDSYIDIDGVVMENKYLQDRVKQLMEEKKMTAGALSKCRALLEKKSSGSALKFSSIAAGLAVSARQVEQLLQNNHFLDKVGNSGNSSDFRNLVASLLEALSDKTLALSHQKKANKILGHRLSELEQKVKSKEAATFWQFHDNSHLRYLLGNSHSEDLASEKSTPKHSVISVDSSGECYLPDSMGTHHVEDVKQESQPKPNFVESSRTKSSFSDLDLLPTKECSIEQNNCISSGVSEISDSLNTTPLQTPTRRTISTSTDSDSSPQKTMRAKRWSLTPQNSLSCLDKHDPAVLDIDDLPPKLQELFVAALAEMDDDDDVIEPNNESLISPCHKVNSPVKVADPSC